MHDDVYYMRMAIRQARLAEAAGEVPTGCVLIDRRPAEGGERLIGQAYNQVETLRDPTAHAEILAITQAAAARRDWRLDGTVLYVTKEPCAMCAGAIVLARITRVVFGAADPLRGGACSVFNILRHPQLHHRCEVTGGVLADVCAGLLRDFFRRRRAARRERSGSPDPECPDPGL